jgi:putative membrane protein
MSGMHMSPPSLEPSTRLAATRTRLAHERTLMAWIRTCTSLIAFGFTMYQVFRYLAVADRLDEPLVSPQWVGLMMLLIGLCALVVAWMQHRRDLAVLRAEFGEMPMSLASVAAALIALLGVMALLGVLVRL